MTRHIEVDLSYAHESQLEAYKDEDMILRQIFSFSSFFLSNFERSGIYLNYLLTSEYSSSFKSDLMYICYDKKVTTIYQKYIFQCPILEPQMWKKC